MNSAPAFHAYGPAHLIVIFLTTALPFALAALVRKTKSRLLERAIISALSLVLVLNYLAYLALIRGMGVHSWSQMLPMQLCDWAMLVVIVAMWTGNRSWFEVAYFWGIGGTVQAVLTPNLAYGLITCPLIAWYYFYIAVVFFH